MPVRKPMTVPMIVLAIGSAVVGFLLVYVWDIEHWLEPVTGYAEAEGGPSSAVLIAAT